MIVISIIPRLAAWCYDESVLTPPAPPNSQGKSSLWSHLLNHQELESCKDASQPIDPNFLSPGER